MEAIIPSNTNQKMLLAIRQYHKLDQFEISNPSITGNAQNIQKPNKYIEKASKSRKSENLVKTSEKASKQDFENAEFFKNFDSEDEISENTYNMQLEEKLAKIND